MKQKLADSIEDYKAHRRNRPKGNSEARLKSIDITLRRFLTVTGNILTENIREEHVDAYFAEASKKRGKNSLRIDITDLKQFTAWAIRTRRMGRHSDPMAGWEPPKVSKRPWRGFHVSKVPALLDACTHPRDRILLALGCYLIGRSIEFRILRIGDVDLDAGFINFYIPKPDKHDLMPISQELDEELRRWLTFYAETAGPLDPNWFLVPAKTAARPGGSRRMDTSTIKLLPTRRMGPPHEHAKRALEQIGYSTTGPDGRGSGEGMHTVRRSIARALAEQLRDEGDPNPIETVRAMLNHSTEKQTRDYIGWESGRLHRDNRIKGQLMFPGLRAGTVSDLGAARLRREELGSSG